MKSAAGWMVMGPIQAGPVSPAGGTIVIIITTHNREEPLSSLYLNFTKGTNPEQGKKSRGFYRHTREEKRRNVQF